MSESPAAGASDCRTLPYSVQCISEVNQAPATSQLVVVKYKVVLGKDKQEELVTGIENFVPLHFSDSKRHKSLAK